MLTYCFQVSDCFLCCAFTLHAVSFLPSATDLVRNLGCEFADRYSPKIVARQGNRIYS